MRGRITRMAFAVAVLAAISGAAARPAAFEGWPAGTEPKEVGARIVKQFMSTEPEGYQAKGFTGGNYGGGKYVVYSVASLWVNALEYASLIKDADLQRKLTSRLHPFYPGGAKQDKVTKPRHVDFNIFGAVPLEVAILTGDKRALTMGLRYADDQWEPPRPDDLDNFPKWLKSHYVEPEKQREYLKQGYSGQTRLWIDDMYMINVLQTQAYRATRDRTYIARAAKEMCLYLEKLQLPNGLFNHAADVPFRWGRGNGWMAAGMPMILQYLKPGDGHYDQILAGYRRMMETLLKFQRPDGLWGQLVDDPESWGETSGTAMFAFAFIKGVKHGWLDAATYAPAARKAYLAVCATMDADGNVANVCCGTGAKNDRQYYYDRKKINGDPHGQAPLLWCVNALLGYDAPEYPLEFPPKGFKVSAWSKQNPPMQMEQRLKLINPAAPGELRLTPTFCSCSVCWGVKAPVEGIALEDRKPGGEWRRGETPLFFGDAENYRGSLFYLDEDSGYEARLTAGGKTLAQGTFRTWKSDVPVARTVVIDPATATYPIKVRDQGTPDGWIRYTAKPGTVLGGKDLMTAVFDVQHARYVLLDDMVIQGGGGNPGQNNPVFIAKSKGVRVRNCEIYGYGRAGVPRFTATSGGKFFTSDGRSSIDWDAGVMIYPETEEIVVERCYIHDPRGRANSWYYSHPAGMQGIFVFRVGHSVVLRWNDLVGSDLHRWNDAIEGCDNFGPAGGFNRDADIYGNFCIFANDDCIELDGGQQNVRCFQNRFESAVSAVSIQGCLVSPVYVIDNLLGPCGEEFGFVNPCIKTSAFDMYWYSPYAGIWGNYFAEKEFKPQIGANSRYDIRSSNVFSTGEVPRDVATKYPVRDLPFLLDTGRITGVTVAGNEAAPKSVTFKATAPAEQPFVVRKNFTSDWFDVEPSQGTLKKGENVFRVTFRPEKMKDRRFWRAAFLVRTPEGLSRCVSVYAERTDFAPPENPVPAGTRTMYAALPAPVAFNNASCKKGEPVELAFDVAEAGDYWLFARVQGVDQDFPLMEISVDGGAYKPAIVRTWTTHAVWNMVSPGKKGKFSGSGFVAPMKFEKGRHTFRLRPHLNNNLTLQGFAVSDQPLAFEPR